MTDDPYNLSRFDDLRPGLDFVIFDPDAEGGMRVITPDESARLRDAVRLPSERADRGAEPAAPDRPERVEDRPSRSNDLGDGRMPGKVPDEPAEPVADFDEQAWRDRLGLDEPGRIPGALEPDRSADLHALDDEELER